MKTVAECYERNKPIDALLLCLHGATQSVEMDDVSGWILEQLRRQVGDEVIISVGCDLHANVTKRWMDHADFICGYQMYPHINRIERKR